VIKKVHIDVSGDIADRVKFLRERIKEVKKALEERKALHEKAMAEINAEIDERLRMLTGLSDDEKIREFKVDITLLMMERRRENLSYWRDLVNLRSELMSLLEEYENELKIAKLMGVEIAE